MRARRKIQLVIAIILLVFSLLGCSPQAPESLQESAYISRVQGWQYGKADCHYPYVFTEWGEGGTQYDMCNGELVTNYCEDPECDGKCFLERGDAKLNQIEQNRLYFTQYEAFVGDIHYCYRDLLTGEVKVMVTLTRQESSGFDLASIDQGNLYYMQLLLKNGGDPDNAADYELYICRVNCEGGPREVVYSCRSKAEHLLNVVDNRIYTIYEGGLYRTDLETKEQKLLFSATDHGFSPGFGNLQYIDGKLYTMVNRAGGGVSVLNGKKIAPDRRVIMIDAETGEWKDVLNTTIVTYCITNDAIYFSPLEPHQVSDPEIYTIDDAETKYLLASKTLYACDLNGENAHPVWTDESGLLNYVECYTVVNDILYGWIFSFIPEENAYEKHYFAEIHFDTGEIIPAIVVD